MTNPLESADLRLLDGEYYSTLRDRGRVGAFINPIDIRTRAASAKRVDLTCHGRYSQLDRLRSTPYSHDVIR
jgi:hypothetical protein